MDGPDARAGVEEPSLERVAGGELDGPGDRPRDRHLEDVGVLLVAVAGARHPRHVDPDAAVLRRLDRAQVAREQGARDVPDDRFRERLLDLGLEAERVRERLRGQLRDGADRVLERRHHRLAAERSEPAADSASSVSIRMPTSTMGRASAWAAWGPMWPLIRPASLSARKLTTLLRPMIPIPIRMNGSAAITTGMNCSTSATGLTPGVAASSWRASFARAVSRSATGSRDEVCDSASDSATTSATRASVGARSDSASRVSNASVISASDSDPGLGRLGLARAEELAREVLGQGPHGRGQAVQGHLEDALQQRPHQLLERGEEPADREDLPGEGDALLDQTRYSLDRLLDQPLQELLGGERVGARLGDQAVPLRLELRQAHGVERAIGVPLRELLQEPVGLGGDASPARPRPPARPARAPRPPTTRTRWRRGAGPPPRPRGPGPLRRTPRPRARRPGSRTRALGGRPRRWWPSTPRMAIRARRRTPRACRPRRPQSRCRAWPLRTAKRRPRYRWRSLSKVEAT